MLEFVVTADGSKTIFHPEIGEHYHSKHGALQESRHVFLKSGLEYFLEKNHPRKVSILEVGLGTGLNFLLTADFCTKNKVELNYTGIEAFPLSRELIVETGYQNFVDEYIWKKFTDNYLIALNAPIALHNFCTFEIAYSTLLNFKVENLFDVIYFDAFAASHQPEMWTDEALSHACQYIKPGGVFVTYAITGNLKRSLKNLGFLIEKAPGAPGKREMLRATKLKL